MSIAGSQRSHPKTTDSRLRTSSGFGGLHDHADNLLPLLQLQLAPSSVLLLSFVEDSFNDPALKAPLLDQVLAHAQDLPPPPKFDDPAESDTKQKTASSSSKDDSTDKKLPKWLKLGSPSSPCPVQ